MIRFSVLVVAALLGGAEGEEALRRELAWTVPPGWVPGTFAGPDLTAHHPQNEGASLLVGNTETRKKITPEEIRRTLKLFRSEGMPVPTAMLGTCSNGRARFACEEMLTRLPERLEVSYGWLDEKRGWNFAASYSLTPGTQGELLATIRKVVGWKAKQAVRE